MVNLSLTETRSYFDKLFSIETELKAALEDEEPDTKHQICLMLDYLERWNGCQDGYKDQTSVSMQFLEAFSHKLPYLAIERPDAATLEFIINFTLLLQNYSRATQNQRFTAISDTLGKLVEMHGSFTELLILARQLVKQYQRYRDRMPDTIEISKRYIKHLLGEE